MSSFNKVIVMGNLTQTPELRSTPGGTQVSDITVAVNENWTDQSGQSQERVTFVDITVWGKTAETVCRWKKKGDAVLVEGRLQQDKWVDKETGKNRTKLKVVAENVRFVGGRGQGEGGGGENEGRSQAPRSGGRPYGNRGQGHGRDGGKPAPRNEPPAEEGSYEQDYATDMRGESSGGEPPF